jgi:hypothetical protein
MGTAAGVDGAFAVWNVVTTFSGNDISAYSGWHSADGRSLVPSNLAPQNPCGEINPTPHEPPGSHRNPLALNLLSSDRTPIAFVIVWGTARSCSPAATPRWRCYEPPQGMRLLRTAGAPEVHSPTCPRRRCIRCRVGVADPATRFMRHVHGRHRAAMTCRACSFPPHARADTRVGIPAVRRALGSTPLDHPRTHRLPGRSDRPPLARVTALRRRDAVARTAREPLSDSSRRVRDGASAVSLPRLMAVLWHPHRRGASTAYASPNRAAGLAAGRAAGATAVAGHSR